MRGLHVSVLALAVAGVSLAVATQAGACAYPDEGNMPLRRAVSAVKYLPQTVAWAKGMHDAGAVVQYALSLDRDWHHDGHCYWTIEARAQGRTWRRFYVSPDGRSLLSEDGRPVAREPRKARASPAATAERR